MKTQTCRLFGRNRFWVWVWLLSVTVTGGLRADNRGAEALTLLRGTVIPEVNFREARLEDVVDLLREATRAADPAGRGVNFVLTPEAALKPAKITLNLREVPAGDVLVMVMKMTECRVDLRGNIFIISPLAPPR